MGAADSLKSESVSSLHLRRFPQFQFHTFFHDMRTKAVIGEASLVASPLEHLCLVLERPAGKVVETD